MHKAAGRGASGSSSFASLERSLDGTIDLLTKSNGPPESKALLIEAKRLRSVVANWRSIPPAPDIHDEMLDRALHLAAQAAATAQRAQPEEGDGAAAGDEEAHSLDFEPRIYSLEDIPSATPPPPRKATTPPRRAATPAERPLTYSTPRPPPMDEPLDEKGDPPPPDGDPQGSSSSDAVDRDNTYPPLQAYRKAETNTPPRRVDPPPVEMEDTDEAAGIPSEPPAPRPTTDSPPPATPATGRRTPAGDPETGTRSPVTVHQIKLPEKIDPEIVMLGDTYSDRADAYRALRRKLASASNPRVIAVTSPGPGEGKTTTAINLALSMREGARGKVLLLEANVRAPSLGKTLGFDPPACFADQILLHREDPVLPWEVVEVLPQLHVLAVDARIKHAPLLDALAFSSAMDQLKAAGYEYIVIDTPPVIGSFEVNMIADTVDGVLFCAITMKSRKRALKKAIEQIMPAPVLGAIVLDT